MSTLAELLRIPSGTAGVIQRPDGTRLHTLEIGDGPTVLLVHGFSASVDEWSVLMPALVETGHRVIAYDHRAHGRSTLGADGCTSHALFSDLVAVAAHFDVADAVLVGHSMGTFTCLGALADPALRARTRGVVLVSTETGHLYKGSPLATAFLPLIKMGLLARLTARPTIGRKVAASAVGSAASPEVVEATRQLLASGPVAARPFISVMARDTVAPAIPAVDVPLRLLLGSDDTATPLWHSQLVAERAADASLRVLPGVGHMVNWERPDAIVDEVRALAQT